jgi:hypothetical protein
VRDLLIVPGRRRYAPSAGEREPVGQDLRPERGPQAEPEGGPGTDETADTPADRVVVDPLLGIPPEDISPPVLADGVARIGGQGRIRPARQPAAHVIDNDRGEQVGPETRRRGVHRHPEHAQDHASEQRRPAVTPVSDPPGRDLKHQAQDNRERNNFERVRYRNVQVACQVNRPEDRVDIAGKRSTVPQ